ncbi:MAG: restriction modification system specificity domain protein [Schlesneria sp.]|nr:restriction modification system specificity domain protein [Schlesneria sp.]
MKPGYKRSDAGLIPADWAAHTVGQLIEFHGGSQPDKSFFSATPRPGYVRLIQIRDYKSDKFEVFAPTALLRRFCHEDDIMIGRYGPPIFQILRGLTGAYNVALIKAKPCTAIDRDFAYYFLKQDSLFAFIEKLSRRSSGQTGVDLVELRTYPLPLPPLPEQRAIAEALNDADALLGALDQLIAKKRDLKQAAMQQILTGQTRLTGFAPVNPRFRQTDLGRYPSDWNLKRLGQLVDKSRSIRYGIVQPGKYDARGRLMIRGQDYSKGWVEPTEMFRVSDPIEERYRNARVRSGDLIITIVGAGTGTVESIPDWLNGANLTQTTARIAIDGNEACSGFCKYILQTKVGTQQVASFIKGGAQPGLNCGDIEKFDIPMPTTVAEQTAIAEVLSDMDAELAGLEQRREKTRAIKQGMMQDLLPGRIRLV